MREYFRGDRIDKFKNILYSWLGTPYKHMGRLKGRAADCTLFIGECGIEMGIYKKIEYDYYPHDWHIVTKQEIVLDGIKRNMKNLKEGLSFKEVKDDLKFGDWIIFSISPQGVSNHSGIYLGDGKFISAIEKEGVCIKDLTRSWKKAIKYVFRLYEQGNFPRKLSDERGGVAIPLVMGLSAAAGTALTFGLSLTSFWVSAAFFGGSLLGSWLFPSGQKMPDMNMKPASLADFQVTQAKEGQNVPLTYGTVKIPGNIIYYGNLVTVAQKEEVSGGGKGGHHHHSHSQTTGYKYYLDVWQSIAYGKISIVKTYINDKAKDVSYSSAIFNDGTGEEKPDIGLEYATKLNGISHIFYKKEQNMWNYPVHEDLKG